MRAAIMLTLALSAVGTAASAAEAPLSRPVTKDLFGLPVSDSVWVCRVSATAEYVSPACLAPPDVARRLRDLLLGPGHEPVYDEWPSPKTPPEYGPGQLVVCLFGGFPPLDPYRPRAVSLTFTLWFHEARATISSAGLGSISIRDDGPELLELVKRSLPADSVVQHYNWNPAPDSLGAPQAPPGSDKDPSPR